MAAQVSIHESETVRLVPNVLSDPNDFGSLADLHGISRKEGYQGGLILQQEPGKVLIHPGQMADKQPDGRTYGRLNYKDASTTDLMNW